jgi:hypothetical protein
LTADGMDLSFHGWAAIETAARPRVNRNRSRHSRENRLRRRINPGSRPAP